MENVLNRLSEIETAATQLLDAAASENRKLDLKMQQQMDDFDRQLEEKTAARVEQSKIKLNNSKLQELNELKADNRKLLETLDEYYRKNHKKISNEIFNELIRM